VLGVGAVSRAQAGRSRPYPELLNPPQGISVAGTGSDSTLQPSERLGAGPHEVALFSEGHLAAAAAGSPLAARTAPADPAGLIVMCATAPTAAVMLREHLGRTPHTITATTTDEGLSRIALGDAFGLAPATTPDGCPHPGVTHRPVQDPPPVEVTLFWRSAAPIPTPEPRRTSPAATSPGPAAPARR